MKSKIFIIIFLSFFTLNIIADETEDIKDSNSLFLIVIPLFNISAKKEFDNISFEIQNSLIKKINSYNYFSIYNWEKAEYIFYANNFDYNKLIFEDDQQKIKELTGVDITIVGFYKITENYIHIYLKCFEKKDKVESFSFEYLNDYDENKIKDAIEYSTKEMANMVFEKYKKKIIVKNRIVDLTKEARGKFSIKSRNIAGYVLFGSGAILTLSGIISFAINTSYNKEKEKDLFPKYLNTEITADDYNNFSRDWLIFSLSSLSTMTVGISTLFISIPMFAYGNRSLNLKNKIGFAIYSSGISLFAIGLSFMLFDFTYYFSYISNMILLYNKEIIEYSKYEDVYNQNIAYFTVGLTLFSSGLIMTIVSLPFLLNQEKDKKERKKSFSLLIEHKKDIIVGLRYTF